MVLVDYLIILTLFISCLISFLKGFFQEILSIFFWITSIYISINYYSFFSKHFISIHNKILKNFIMCFLLFIIIITLESCSKYILTEFILQLGCGQTNKMLGLAFGFIKGTILISILIFVLNTFTSFSTSHCYKQSILIPYFNYFIKKILIFIKTQYF
ncbi:CvpA family protein [Buchnera aphidicola]|uniref:Colicin V production protein n=1 Tax=Buchnera aphidicola (Anoecia oenotherae) TaxID=1241833 RepID=A0A4D6XZ38_9GAMM|nr:CvpA family protein [Buchnera aphidicola]QCI19270.1 colicin V production protein [Buchnera aphidicola (Anoecia oenotherae)]